MAVLSAFSALSSTRFDIFKSTAKRGLNKPLQSSRFSITTFGCIKIWVTARRKWRGAVNSSFQNEKTRDGLRAGTVSCAAGIGAGLLRDAIVRTLLIAVGGTLLVKHFGANTLADMPVK